MNLNDLKIGQRLALGFGAVLALAVAIAGVSYLLLLDSKAEQAALAALEHRAQLVSDWEAKTALNVTRTIAIAKSSHAGTAAHFGPLMQETSAQISALQKELDSGTASAQGKALLAAIGEKRKTYLDLRKQLSELARGGDAAATEAVLTGQVLPASQAYLASMGALRDYQLGASAEKQAQLVAAIERGETTLIVLLLASLAVGAAMAVFITRSVTRPVREAVATAQTIAGGDLSHTLRSTRRDELGELLRALGRMQESLRGLVGDVRLITDSVNTASAEISTGNHDLSARTEQAASNLQETAASMEQITATVRRSSESTQRADQLATSAAAVAQRGGQVVSDVVSTMSEINSSSRRIADIIGVIDGIAFQTNILALNAAVEAARAGEHGRGFAVVASEVRTLAQRSAGAAKEIKGLISASVDKVDSGSRLVADAGSTMHEIVASVQRVTQIIREINAGAAEQSQGIGQVNEAVTQLDQMTQQNAALVEQSAAAAESLKDQAHRLVRVVGSFRTAAA